MWLLYVDNKSYAYPVRGGKLTAFLLVDLKSLAIFKLDVFFKDQNGAAFSRIISQEGVHKLPYKCTVYHDNCGSMAHVVSAATRMGISSQPLPPKEQSLNLAEKAIDIGFKAADAHLFESGRDRKVHASGGRLCLPCALKDGHDRESGVCHSLRSH
jgi:hypothetical protein